MLSKAIRAAGVMLVPVDSPSPVLFAAAALVHSMVSLFWATVFAWVLPRRHIVRWSVLGSAAVALLDLRVITPVFFSSVAALAFWPPFADHLMWGACLGFAPLRRSS